MHLTRSKYRKFYNEDRSSSSGYRNGEKTTPSKIIESTNGFAFTELIAEMDHGEHESAMKEFVTLHTEPREMTNLLSLVQPPLASPIASSGLKSYQANAAVSDQCNQRNQMNLEQHNGMDLTSRKKRKFYNEDTHSSPTYRNGEKTSPSDVIDYSNGFAFSELLSGLDCGKYGSVTKEYEALLAQRRGHNLSLIQPLFASPISSSGHNLSLVQPLFASPISSPGLKSLRGGGALYDQYNQRNNVNLEQNDARYVREDIIDLDGDSSVVEKRGKSKMSAIVLDSDEEDGGDEVGKIHHSPTSELKPLNNPVWLSSQLQLYRAASAESNYNQLAPCEKLNAPSNFEASIEERKPPPPPSVKYEKVVLMSVSQKQRIQCGKDVVLRNEIEGHFPHDKVVLQNEVEKLQGVSQNYGAGRDKKNGESLHGEVNGDPKESAARTSTISSMEMQDDSPGVECHNEDDTEISEIDGLECHNEDDTERVEIDGLEDLWNDRALALESIKADIPSDDSVVVQRGEPEDDCNHSYVLDKHGELGEYCKICGKIRKRMETIFDFRWKKAPQIRTYMRLGSKHSKDVDEDIPNSMYGFSEDNIFAAEISVHPRHMKQMKPHQLDGFNFLVRNLLAANPGGCILAHAPGSGKTFMLISFIQSFLAKFPDARPLVILPKGIVATWKKEFLRWQVEDIPIYDFYSSNANSRSQQLDVLKAWQENRSVLLSGYKQFSNIISGDATDKIASACQEMLLKVPSLLIMDEGHTPRNTETDVLSSLKRVQTPRKVVLSGTLFQNHVKEVFNIFDLVRPPTFVKLESSRTIVKRILSRVNISGRRSGAVDQFYELVEETLQHDDNYKRKISVIQDLRELTRNVLHYYRGDFAEELPGFVDFTVFLNLSPKQKEMVQNLGRFEHFKRSSVGKAVYVHPCLKDLSEHAAGERVSAVVAGKIDKILDTVDAEDRDGVKTNFFLSILSLAVAAKEKMLVFSQYLLSLQFLEKVVIRAMGWRPGKEIFMISGETSPEQREFSMDQFNSSPDAKIFFGSIKACGEGISLVGASRVLILDVHLNPSVTRQAIGRAYRPGQKKKVYTYRLVAAGSPEEEDHKTSFRKELMSKMWFEWSEYGGHHEFELEQVHITDCEDRLLESDKLRKDIKALYRR